MRLALTPRLLAAIGGLAAALRPAHHAEEHGHAQAHAGPLPAHVTRPVRAGALILHHRWLLPHQRRRVRRAALACPAHAFATIIGRVCDLLARSTPVRLARNVLQARAVAIRPSATSWYATEESIQSAR